jgi:hypothetical protein
MSDDDRRWADTTAEDPGARIFRAALPGWQSTLSRSADRRAARAEALFAPGRGYLEGAILFDAFAILAPMCGVAAIALALLARRAGNRRWLAATLAGVWCAFLGVVVRSAMGFPVVP